MSHDKLRELAQAADDLAPGDWSHMYEFLKEDIWEKADAEFIAAASPAVILALLDELRDAKAQALRDAARNAVNKYRLGTSRDEADSARSDIVTDIWKAARELEQS